MRSHSVGPKLLPMAAWYSAAERNTAVICASPRSLSQACWLETEHHLAGHVARQVARQEHDDVGDLPGLGGAAERLAALEFREQLIGGHAVEECVHGDARGHRVDAHAVGSAASMATQRVKAMTPALAAA